MFEHEHLSEAEWGLIAELLEREQNELPPEIHHTDNAAVRNQLQRRLETVRELLKRLRSPAAV